MGGSYVSFVRPSHADQVSSVLVRGGAATAVADEDMSEIESSDYDEDEEEEEEKTLVKATQKKVTKAAKKAVASGLAASKPKKKKSNGLKLFKIPYILGAFNLNYLKQNEVSRCIVVVIVSKSIRLIRFCVILAGFFRKSAQCSTIKGEKGWWQQYAARKEKDETRASQDIVGFASA
jgi:hypothetical protein